MALDEHAQSCNRSQL